MRLLLATPALPTPTDGGLLAPFHLARRWAARHAVRVVTIRRPDDRPEDLAQLAAAGVEVEQAAPDDHAGLLGRVRRLLSPVPGIVAMHDHAGMRAALARAAAAKPPDAVIAFTCNLAPQLDALPGRVKVLVAYDAESQLARRTGLARPGALGRLLASLHAWKYARLEAGLYPRFSAVVVVGRRDQEWLRASVPAARFELVPNGVDLEYFGAAVAPVVLDPPAGGPAAVLTGTLNVPSTVDAIDWYAREVAPAVRARVPGSELWLVGRSPTAAVRALAARPGVRVTGAVPDVRPWVAASRVFLAPFRFGGGMKQKVLEALAAGVPVVATSEAVAGFEGPLARHVAIADTAADFAARVAERLAVEPDRARVRAESRADMLDRYGWEACAARYEALLAELAGAAPP